MDDLRITGGRLLDPSTGLDLIGDLAVTAGIIRDAGNIRPSPAREVIDATGLLVTPGLVDIHTHFHAGATFWGISPDPIAWHTGVTTWIDAGSVGAYGLDALSLARNQFRIRSGAFLHISTQGLTSKTGESRDLSFLDENAAIAAIKGNREFVHGIKVRLDATASGDSQLEPLRIALRAAEAAEVPVMVHIAKGPFDLNDAVDMLRPGDIFTHCAGKIARGVTESGPILESLHAAYNRGVLFDIGHGSGGFNFEVVEGYFDEGMPPHTISTDLHVLSANGPASNLPLVMSKLLAVGMSLADAITATTSAPSLALGLSAGSLKNGAAADFALFRLIDGPVQFKDVDGLVRTGQSTLRAVATYVGGIPLPPAYPAPPPSWAPLSEVQHASLLARDESLRELLNQPLDVPFAGCDLQQNRRPN